MSGINRGLDTYQIINIIDRLKTIFRSDSEQDFLTEIKSRIIAEGNQFDANAFVDRTQKESEILHELSRAIRWANTVENNDEYKFYE